MTSLVGHFKHSGIRSVAGGNTEQTSISENWRRTAADAPIKGTNPLRLIVYTCVCTDGGGVIRSSISVTAVASLTKVITLRGICP